MSIGREEINRRGGEILYRQAQETRQALLEESFRLLLEQLAEQEVLQNGILRDNDSQRAVLEYPITEEPLIVPGELTPRSMLSFFLRKPVCDTKTDHPESLRVFLPVPDDFTLEDELDISRLAFPDVIIMQHTTSEGVESWFKVTQRAIVPYSADVIDDSHAAADDMVPDDIGVEMMMDEIEAAGYGADSTTATWLMQKFIRLVIVNQAEVPLGRDFTDPGSENR